MQLKLKQENEKMNAPQLKSNQWFNSEPIDKKDLEGNVVLYDFWTYSCVNCLRTIPYLKDLWAKYKDQGLMIIGIHTPEFEFEKSAVNLKKAINKLGVSWPVVMDNDYENWQAFANHYWPAKYLANRMGEIVYEHFGEGSYGEIEKKIRDLLGFQDRNLYKTKPKELMGGVCYPQTPELYLGHGRGKLTYPQEFHPDREYNYPEVYKIHSDSFALLGNFLVTENYVEALSSVSEIFLNFKGTEVNIVLENEENEAPTLEILLDNKILSPTIRGKDINDKSEITIKEARMYNLIRSVKPLNGILSIRSKDASFKAYAFTFSGCST